MTDCTAKIITAEVTDEVVAAMSPHGDYLPVTRHGDYLPVTRIHEGTTVQRQGEGFFRVEMHEASCTRDVPHTGERSTLTHGSNAHWHKPSETEPWFVEWYDDTPGAIPHRRDPHVEVHAEEVASAVRVLNNVLFIEEGVQPFADDSPAVREALAAAKRAVMRMTPEVDA